MVRIQENATNVVSGKLRKLRLRTAVCDCTIQGEKEWERVSVGICEWVREWVNESG